jgi:hypothetical protein
MIGVLSQFSGLLKTSVFSPSAYIYIYIYIYINKCMFSVLFNKDLYSMFNGMDMLERLKMKDGDNSWKFPQQKPMGTSSLPSSFCHAFFLSSY